jgi:hypothetical protein
MQNLIAANIQNYTVEMSNVSLEIFFSRQVFIFHHIKVMFEFIGLIPVNSSTSTQVR